VSTAKGTRKAPHDKPTGTKRVVVPQPCPFSSPARRDLGIVCGSVHGLPMCRCSPPSSRQLARMFTRTCG
jgi:hypothetical protein